MPFGGSVSIGAAPSDARSAGTSASRCVHGSAAAAGAARSQASSVTPATPPPSECCHASPRRAAGSAAAVPAGADASAAAGAAAGDGTAAPTVPPTSGVATSWMPAVAESSTWTPPWQAVSLPASARLRGPVAPSPHIAGGEPTAVTCTSHATLPLPCTRHRSRTGGSAPGPPRATPRQPAAHSPAAHSLTAASVSAPAAGPHASPAPMPSPAASACRSSVAPFAGSRCVLGPALPAPALSSLPSGTLRSRGRSPVPAPAASAGGGVAPSASMTVVRR